MAVSHVMSVTLCDFAFYNNYRRVGGGRSIGKVFLPLPFKVLRLRRKALNPQTKHLRSDFCCYVVVLLVVVVVVGVFGLGVVGIDASLAPFGARGGTPMCVRTYNI